eukprot:m.48348 g.48348  ORF g.48348 m.48348 type:complete len:259 (+) comp11035_c0_seq2:1082-1858(+)
MHGILLANNRKLSVQMLNLRGISKVGFPNPFNMAAKVMEKLMNAMLDDMAEMATSMASFIMNGTATIGMLADDIVQTEHMINHMGLNIGLMSDCILSTIELGLRMFEKVCAAFDPRPIPTPAPKAPCSPVNATPTTLLLNTEWATFVQLDSPAPQKTTNVEKAMQEIEAEVGAAGFNPFGDFAEMVKLCEKMANMMTSMMKAMSGVAVNVTNAILSISNDIVKTIGLINNMAQQIDVMANRIVKTEHIMEQVASMCTP